SCQPCLTTCQGRVTRRFSGESTESTRVRLIRSFLARIDPASRRSRRRLVGFVPSVPARNDVVPGSRLARAAVARTFGYVAEAAPPMTSAQAGGRRHGRDSRLAHPTVA